MPKKKQLIQTLKKTGILYLPGSAHLCIFVFFQSSAHSAWQCPILYCPHLALSLALRMGGGAWGGLANKKSESLQIIISYLHSYYKMENKIYFIKMFNYFFRFVHRDFVGLFPTPLPLASREESDGMTINISF